MPVDATSHSGVRYACALHNYPHPPRAARDREVNMRIDPERELHLGYCTNVHAGESWSEVMFNLETDVLAVRERVAPGQSFGVGLRLSGQAALSLSQRS